MKLDMAKAYDRVEWTFLLAMMEAMGFPTKFCHRIAECITTGFSALLRQREEHGSLHGVRVAPGEISLSHLFFAYDAVIFYKAMKEEVQEVMDVLQCYAETFGQAINRENSSLYFGANCSRKQHKRLAICTNIKGREDFGKYLGINADFGSFKKAVFEGVREALEGIIKGWAKQFLSPAGKEVFIKAVAIALPNYAMSYFKLLTRKGGYGWVVRDFAGLLQTASGEGGLFFNTEAMAKLLQFVWRYWYVLSWNVRKWRLNRILR
ncbi:uncharacterized protein [Malus domestica]|uniref:uncharacterized protein n=1 Tax=Malus domestica TaxID=3750 RepID=UPI0039749C04